MKTIRRYTRIHRIFMIQTLKRSLEYKVDFLVGMFGMLTGQALQVIFLVVIFSQIPSLKGWGFNDIVFIYAFSLIPKSIDHLLFDNLWGMGYWIVAKGQFDKYMLRPVNTWFQVATEWFQMDAVGEIITAVVLMVYTLPKVTIEWSVLKLMLLFVAVLFSTFIYTGIKTITSSLSFWVKRSGYVTHMVYAVNDFSKYPATIYNKAIREVITYVIPFAFTAYYPALYLLTGENPLFNVGGTVIASLVLCAIGALLWHSGQKVYESAGS